MNSWDLITEDYQPTWEELEAEGLLHRWMDCLGMDAYERNMASVQARAQMNAAFRAGKSTAFNSQQAQQMMGASGGLGGLQARLFGTGYRR